MTERLTRPTAGQEDLFDAGAVQRPAGLVERSVRASVRAADLDERDWGAAAAAIANARALDLQLAAAEPSAGNSARPPGAPFASIAQALAHQLERLQLDPESRKGAETGDIDAWLAKLATPSGAEVGDAPHP